MEEIHKQSKDFTPMENPSPYLDLFIVQAAMCYTPGPGIVMIFNKCLNHGLRYAICFSIGITVAHLILFLFLSLFIKWGLAVLPDLFLYLKYSGAGFLIFLAVKSVIVPQTGRKGLVVHNYVANIMEGLLFTFVNPKALFLYLAVIPVSVTFPTKTSTFALSAAIVAFVVASSTIGYAAIINQLMKRLSLERYLFPLSVVSSIVLIGIAFGMLVSAN